MLRSTCSAIAIALLAAACSSSSSPPPDAGPDGLGDYDPVPFGGDARPTKLYVPSGYRSDTPAPLVILLHGYSVTGGAEELYLYLRRVAETRTVLYAHPDSNVDKSGFPFWNATDACCDFDHTGVDDSGWLASLVAEIGTRYRVDPKRVYFVGHSNGGFMSYRMACDHADTIAAIASLAGAMWLDTSKCKPSAPVSILEIHGTKDTDVLYDGSPTGSHGIGYPGVTTTMADWVTYDGCAAQADTSLPPMDLDSSLPGAETTVTRWANGCRGGTDLTLWTITNGVHIPPFNDSFAPALFDWLLSHSK